MTAITKAVSPELQKLIDQTNATFGKGFEMVKRIYDVAIGQGFSPYEARDLILDNVKAYKKTVLYSYLPDEAKQKTKPKKIPKSESANDEDSLKPARRVTIPESHEIVDADSESEPDQEPPIGAVEQWQAQAENNDKELETLRKEIAELKAPFTCSATVELRGIDVPLTVGVVPGKRRVTVALDAARVRALTA